MLAVLSRLSSGSSLAWTGAAGKTQMALKDTTSPRRPEQLQRVTTVIRTDVRRPEKNLLKLADIKNYGGSPSRGRKADSCHKSLQWLQLTQ